MNDIVNSFDIDGVIFISKEIGGVHPGPNDIIITGRSYEEYDETIKMLKERGINNCVYFNPLKFDEKNRQSSGQHKAFTLNILIKNGVNIGVHFEDDEIQAAEIRKLCPNIPVVLLQHDLTNKENVRHLE